MDPDIVAALAYAEPWALVCLSLFITDILKYLMPLRVIDGDAMVS